MPRYNHAVIWADVYSRAATELFYFLAFSFLKVKIKVKSGKSGGHFVIRTFQTQATPTSKMHSKYVARMCLRLN